MTAAIFDRAGTHRARPHRAWTCRASTCALATALALLAPNPDAAEAAGREPVAATAHFTFYSDLAANLNDALITAGAARWRSRPELFHFGAEEACFRELPAAERAAWDRAVDFYAEIVYPAGWHDREQVLARLEIAGLMDPPEEGEERSENRRFLEVGRAFRAAAAPAYEACRWAAQDAANRRWIEALAAMLAVHEEAIAGRLAQLYQVPWYGLPIPVDVMETVSWQGANTLNRRPEGGHIQISSANAGYQDRAALEMVFHEASHLLTFFGSPLGTALYESGQPQGYEPPRDLWHVVLFYTTGETVRRALRAAGEPPYTPFHAEHFTGGPWGRYLEAIGRVWPAYLDGERTLTEAGADLIGELARAGEGEAGPGG